MATKTKSSQKQDPAKKKETKKQTALPKAATPAKKKKAAKAAKSTAKLSQTPTGKPKMKPAKAALKKSGSKTKKTIARATPKKGAAKTKKTPAKATSKTVSAKKKSQPFVKSKKPTAKTTTVKTTTAKKTVRVAKPKVAKTTKGTSPKSGGARKIAQALHNGQHVAARRAENARPAKEKKQEAAKKDAATSEQKPVPSETAAKVAKTLIRRKAAKKGDARNPKPARPIAFTLDEALEIAKTKPQTAEPHTGNGHAKGTAKGSETAKKEVPDDLKQENRTLGAASVSDILGYNPNAGPKPENDSDVPPKFARYYKLLLELRQHVISGLDIHTKETLKRSSKEDSGNLSAYSQHMADAGTDTFDRDFALSLVSSEQDALYEIEDAIRRIKRGSYGVCEITGKPIKKERLLAVPFAKFSVEGQVEYERTHRKSAYRGGAFGDSTEESVKFMDEDSDE